MSRKEDEEGQLGGGNVAFLAILESTTPGGEAGLRIDKASIKERQGTGASCSVPTWFRQEAIAASSSALQWQI